MGLAYNTGALNSATNHNFVSYYDAHEPDIQEELVQRYMNTIIGFLDFVDAKKSTDAAEFSRFETTANNDTTIFKIYQKRDKSLICTDNIIEIKTTITIELNNSGMNYLKFNTESTEPLLDSVLVTN